jgi:hypothetical protein
MVADVALTDKGHQGSFGSCSSPSLVNPSFMKGTNHQESYNLLQGGGGSQLALGAGRDFLSNNFTTCLVNRL